MAGVTLKVLSNYLRHSVNDDNKKSSKEEKIKRANDINFNFSYLLQTPLTCLNVRATRASKTEPRSSCKR